MVAALRPIVSGGILSQWCNHVFTITQRRTAVESVVGNKTGWDGIFLGRSSAGTKSLTIYRSKGTTGTYTLGDDADTGVHADKQY